MVTLYDLLLRLYPASFRNEYRSEMRLLFRQQLEQAGGVALLALWLRTIADLLTSAAAVHLDMLRQDLSYTARVLRRAPGFAIVVVLIIALGIGATTAAFSVTDFVLFRPLPFHQPGRLVKIWETTPGYSRMELSPPNYRDWKAEARSFESLGAYYSTGVTMTGSGEPRRLPGAVVTAGVLPTLGVRPLIGRVFSAADDRPGAAGKVLLGYGLWQKEFGSDPAVVGRSVTLDAAPYTVIGVMPPAFHFPTSDESLWITARFGEADYAADQLTNNLLQAVGRLRRGVTLEQARAEVELIAARSRQQFPTENKDTGGAVTPLGQELPERSRLLLVALFGASACVLLVACANLANLLLARALSRRRELALRTAIGAGRQRLVRQLVTENLLLAGVGGALGVAGAVAAVPVLTRLVPTTLPLAQSPAVDTRVLLFAACLTAATGLGSALAPLLRGAGDLDLGALRERGAGGQKETLRSVLVAAEIALSIVLLMSSGLLLRALVTVRDIDPGFSTEAVLSLRTELAMPAYASVGTRQAFYTRVLEQVRALPGVRAAGFISFLPMSSFRGGIWPVTVEGDREATVRSADNVACLRYSTPGYLQAMRIPIRRGRDISEGDDRAHPYVAVVSESFARRYWPGQDPIGRHFAFAFADRTVVGVVGDVRFRGLERQSEPQVYLSSQQVADGDIPAYVPRALAVRSSTPPDRLAPLVRSIVHRADPAVPIAEVQTLSDMVGRETATRSVQLRILGAFAAIAFVLAGLGIHGLLSFSVAQRTQEIGVRIALGARPADVVAMIVRRCTVLALAGLVPGVAVAYGVGRSMQALLAGVRPTDGPTLTAAITLSLVMTVAGSLVPALRAVRIDPVTALRSD